MGTYKTIVVDGVDVLLLGDHVAEASASWVLEGNARGFRTQNSINVVAVVELVIEAFWDLDDLGRVTILDDDYVIWLEERPPHLQEVQVSDRGNHYVELIFQQWSRSDRASSHGCKTQIEESEKEKRESEREERFEFGKRGCVCIWRNLKRTSQYEMIMVVARAK